LYVEGRVLTEAGQPAPETISVKLACGMRTLQVVRADLKGYFQFALGAGAQANLDFSAADQSAPTSMLTGVNVPGGYSGFGTGGGNSLTGCELTVSVPGYQPVMGTITDAASLGVIDVGILELRRIATMPGSAVSATSLLAPNDARKEFDQAVKDLRSNKLAQATQHLEKAVAAFDRYAAAWHELGRAYAAGHQMEKARQSYEKAIAADAKYAPPYVGLAAVKLQDQDYAGAAASVAQAVELDPGILIGVAGYIQAVASFRLNRLDAAEQGALAAEKAPHQNTPQLHALLADIYLRREDSPNAAAQIRAYLREAPQGSLAPELKQHLERIEKSAAADGNASSPPEEPRVAP
jgi:tetratricopeptide (TPR) repeat protein